MYSIWTKGDNSTFRHRFCWGLGFFLKINHVRRHFWLLRAHTIPRTTMDASKKTPYAGLAQLKEFHYQLGDRRPTFLRYLLHTYPNIVSHVPLLPSKLRPSSLFGFVCNPQTQKRIVREPSSYYLRRLRNLIRDGPQPLVLIPVVVVNRLNCKQRNASRHMTYVLYNRLTGEAERLDIRKYHLNGFSLKLWIKHLSETLLPKYIGGNARLAPEIDVPLKFLKAVSANSAVAAYPAFLLAYMRERCKHPEATSAQVVASVAGYRKTVIRQVTEGYVRFCSDGATSSDGYSSDSRCGADKVLNPETLRCVKPSNKTIVNTLLSKPVRECRPGMLFNALVNRCMLPGRMVDVNVLLDEVLTGEYKEDRELVHIASSPAIIIGAMNFVLSKYNNAVYLYRNDKPLKHLRKRHTAIYWAYNEKASLPMGSSSSSSSGSSANAAPVFDLRLPGKFWELWEAPMQDPTIQFIISFLSLKSIGGGAHANVLIYDKATNEMERFDGLGRDIADAYHIQEFDTRFEQLLHEQTQLFAEPVKYLTPMDFCPRMPVFQSKELDELPGKDVRGNCAVWRLWYVNVRLANPHLDRKSLVALASKKLEQTGQLYKFIKMYHNYIIASMQQVQQQRHTIAKK